MNKRMSDYFERRYKIKKNCLIEKTSEKETLLFLRFLNSKEIIIYPALLYVKHNYYILIIILH